MLSRQSSADRCRSLGDSSLGPATVQRYAPFCMWDKVRDALPRHCEAERSASERRVALFAIDDPLDRESQFRRVPVINPLANSFSLKIISKSCIIPRRVNYPQDERTSPRARARARSRDADRSLFWK